MNKSDASFFKQGRTLRQRLTDKTQVGRSALPWFYYLCKSISICGKKRLMSAANLSEQFSNECDLIRIS